MLFDKSFIIRNNFKYEVLVKKLIMSRTALISKHLILHEYNETKPRYPLSGIILIEGETIQDVIIIDSNTQVSEILEKYSEWNPIDYSDYYISPGIIDLNARIEWDSFENLTNEAVKGGVSLIAVEPGYYQPLPTINSLYCDIAFVQVIDDNTTFDNISKNVCALKAYLYNPAPNVKSVADLQRIIQQVNKKNIPLIIDPTLPDPRMLYMASPLRHENIENRTNQGITKPTILFAAAFPEAMNSSSNSESSSSDEDNPFPLKSISSQAGEIKVLSFLFAQRSNSDEESGQTADKFLPVNVIAEEEEKEGTPYINA